MTKAMNSAERMNGAMEFDLCTRDFLDRDGVGTAPIFPRARNAPGWESLPINPAGTRKAGLARRRQGLPEAN